MATTPKITTITNYIKDTTLPLINAAGVYALTMASGTISKDYMNPGEVHSKFPALFVMTDGPQTYSPLVQNEYTTGDAPQDITTGYTIRIIGYVKVNNPGDKQKTGVLTDKMDQLISDIVLAMHSDRTLGGNCIAVVLVGTDKSLEHWKQGIGIVEVWFALKWDFKPFGASAYV